MAVAAGSHADEESAYSLRGGAGGGRGVSEGISERAETGLLSVSPAALRRHKVTLCFSVLR